MSEEPAAAPPARARFGILIVAYNAVSTLTKVLDRIPADVWEDVAEVFIFDDASTDETAMLCRAYKRERGRANMNVFRNESNRGYGGNQKLGYKYALGKPCDVVALLHGDGQYAPEVLPRLLAPILKGSADAVIGSRMMTRFGALRGGMPLYKYAGNKVLTAFQNFTLCARLSEFHSGYRAYATAALRAIPFELNSDDFHFDTEILIQLLSRGYRVAEVPIPTYYGTEISRVNGLRYARNVVRTTMDYRLHKAGIKHVAKYAVEGERYPVKLADSTSSHAKIVARVPPGTVVLELGSGAGEIGEALRQKGCRITGVDLEPPRVASAYERFLRQDMDAGLVLPDDLAFDVALLADVLEHLRSPEAALLAVRNRLKLSGRLIASTGNVAFWYYRLSLLFGRFEYAPRGILDQTHVRLYTLRSFRRLLSQAGFMVVRVDATPIPLPSLHPVFRSAPWSWLHAFSHLLASVWKRLFAYQFILEAERADELGNSRR